MRSQKSVFENNHWKNITPHAIINTHWMITSAGCSDPLKAKNSNTGWRAVNISNKHTIASNSFEPPTAHHHGGVFINQQ